MVSKWKIVILVCSIILNIVLGLVIIGLHMRNQSYSDEYIESVLEQKEQVEKKQKALTDSIITLDSFIKQTRNQYDETKLIINNNTFHQDSLFFTDYLSRFLNNNK